MKPYCNLLTREHILEKLNKHQLDDGMGKLVKVLKNVRCYRIV